MKVSPAGAGLLIMKDDLSRNSRGIVYILQCANGKYYVGSTIDLQRRLQEHLSDIGALFTKAHLPVKLVYTEEYDNEHEARIREQQLHKWSHAKKEALIRGDIENLVRLAHHK